MIEANILAIITVGMAVLFLLLAVSAAASTTARTTITYKIACHDFLGIGYFL